MKLLTKSLIGELPSLYSQERSKNPTFYVKFFDPCSHRTWFVMEYHPAKELFFGVVKGQFTEYGYFTLEELKKFKNVWGLGVERDLHFEKCKLLDLAEENADLQDFSISDVSKHLKGVFPK